MVVSKMTLKTKTIAVMLSVSLLLFGCGEPSDSMYISSPELFPYQQESFQEHVLETRAWLTQHREFHGKGQELELDAVSPFELIPEKPNGKGVLLVHGLGDSPFSFSDIAPELVKQGYLVRVILLPGHGSRPADLMLPTLSDWNNIVAHNVELLLEDVTDVWLGGFSTGTNLVTTYAANNQNVEGLILFSPAFVSRDPLVRLASLASYFVDWADKDKEQNYSRYDSLAMNGAALYYESTVEVVDALQNYPLTIPAILMMSEADELISSKGVYKVFKQYMRNPNNQIIWYGERDYKDERFVQFTMNRPDLYIRGSSHIAPLYSEVNPLYGKGGVMRQCGTLVNETEIGEVECPELNNVWHSAWGFLFKEDKISARLSWNPYFDETMSRVFEVMDSVAPDSLSNE